METATEKYYANKTKWPLICKFLAGNFHVTLEAGQTKVVNL